MEAIKFSDAFKYPFNKAVRMWNILWILLPIFGWFALGGYTVKLVQAWIKGNFKELPQFDFGANMSLGFMMFLKSIPFTVVYLIVQTILGKIPYAGTIISLFISIFIVPILAINFFNKETVGAYFEFDKVAIVFDNIGDYIVAILKSIGLQIIFLLMIVILVGIPAGTFTKNIFLADFYRRNIGLVKKA